jgi:hypothetical protein
MIWALRCQLSSFSSAEKENDKSGGKQKLEADIVVIELVFLLHWKLSVLFVPFSH